MSRVPWLLLAAVTPCFACNRTRAKDEPTAGSVQAAPSASASSAPARAPAIASNDVDAAKPRAASTTRSVAPAPSPGPGPKTECKPSTSRSCTVFASTSAEGMCTIFGNQRCGSDGRWQGCEGSCTYLHSWSPSAQCCRRSSRYDYKSEYDYSTSSWVNRTVRVEYNDYYPCSVSCSKTVELKSESYTPTLGYRELYKSCGQPMSTCY
jgi:hypothetical protein